MNRHLHNIDLHNINMVAAAALFGKYNLDK